MRDYKGMSREEKKVWVQCKLATCSPERRTLYRRIEGDLIQPSWQWPEKMMTDFWSTHLTYSARCRLCYFLLGNRLPPSVIVEWCISQPGYLSNDRAAVHIAGLIEAHSKGGFDGETGTLKTFWSLDNRSVETLHTPSFAYDKQPISATVTVLDADGERKKEHLSLPPGIEYWKKPMDDMIGYAKTLPRQ
jgi:hypothetical protein